MHGMQTSQETIMNHSPRSLNREAFTLVELLVVIAIIGTLVGLLLPAVQYAREAARQAKCANTLKELSSGVLQFESARGYLPPGGFEWHAGYQRPGTIPSRTGVGQKNAGWSWLYYVLPFMEEMNLYSIGAVQSGETLEADGGSPERGRNLAGFDGKGYGATWMRCPSDDQFLTLARTASNYTACAGPKPTSDEATCATGMPASSYTGAVSAWSGIDARSCSNDPNTCRGMFMYNGGQYAGAVGYNPNEEKCRRRIKHIIDGTAKTIMLGETRATNRLKEDDNNNAFVGWGNVPTSTMMPINMKDIDYPAGCDPGNWGTGLGFKSKHRNGANFSFGDGTVKFVSETLNINVFQLMGHHADGKSSIGND